jgi:DNA-binding PadR family transcriptional regulator
MIRLGRRTGYEIKQLADVSARFFWATSYGQIYPELKRLETEGLIRGEDAATNGRARRAYELTPEGEAALDDWLRSAEPLLLETRDEGLLKLFFSGTLTPAERADLIRAMRARHDDILARLSSVEEHARAQGGGPYEVLRFGLAFHGFCSDYLEKLERQAVT